MLFLCKVPNSPSQRLPSQRRGWGCGRGGRHAAFPTGFCKPLSMMKCLSQLESLSLHRACLIFEMNKYAGVVYWIAATKRDGKPIIHEMTYFYESKSKGAWRSLLLNASTLLRFDIIYHLSLRSYWGSLIGKNLTIDVMQDVCSGQDWISLAHTGFSAQGFLVVFTVRCLLPVAMFPLVQLYLPLL